MARPTDGDPIKDICAIEALDSRGNPTVSAKVTTASGAIGLAYSPSGASTGAREAHELRDGDSDRYAGKGVQKAVLGINKEIRETLLQFNCLDQEGLDRAMIALDGTASKSRLGANGILAVSLACAKAAAQSTGTSLHNYIANTYNCELQYTPLPMANILNGGAHANNGLDVQECMIQPVKANSFSEGMRVCVEVFQQLKKLIDSKGYSTAVGDEGGFAPDISNLSQAMEWIVQAIDLAGYRAGEDITIALDCAATEYYRNGKYDMRGEQLTLTSAEKVDWLADLCAKYPITSLEDPLDESDIDGWKLINAKLGNTIQLVGDDLFCSNVSILNQGIEAGWSPNSILIKVNQIGTLTETLETMSRAQKNNMSLVVSHRSGETEDTFVADLAVGTGAGQIKTGAPSRSDRVAKYNRLLWIEQESRVPFGATRTLFGFNS